MKPRSPEPLFLPRVRRTLLPTLLVLWVAPARLAAPDSTVFTLVPEMERPQGILYQPETERRELRQKAAGQRGLRRLDEHVRALWPQVLKVDLVELSRYQVEATREFQLPSEPGKLEGQVIAWDDDAVRATAVADAVFDRLNQQGRQMPNEDHGIAIAL